MIFVNLSIITMVNSLSVVIMIFVNLSIITMVNSLTVVIIGPPQAPKNADFTSKFRFGKHLKPFFAPAALLIVRISSYPKRIPFFLSKSLLSQEITQNLLLSQDR